MDGWMEGGKKSGVTTSVDALPEGALKRQGGAPGGHGITGDPAPLVFITVV